MAGITTSWRITRTLLSLGDLTLGSRSSFVPDGSGSSKWVPKGQISLGKVPQRLTLTRSPFIPGGSLVHTVLDLAQGKFACQVEAEDYPTLLSKRDEVITGFRQRTYQLWWASSDGGSQGWTCMPADVEMLWDEEFAYNLVSTLQFSFYRQPVPLAGAY